MENQESGVTGAKLPSGEGSPQERRGRTCLWDRAGLVSVGPRGWGKVRQRQASKAKRLREGEAKAGKARQTRPGQAVPRQASGPLDPPETQNSLRRGLRHSFKNIHKEGKLTLCKFSYQKLSRQRKVKCC